MTLLNGFPLSTLFLQKKKKEKQKPRFLCCKIDNGKEVACCKPPREWAVYNESRKVFSLLGGNNSGVTNSVVKSPLFLIKTGNDVTDRKRKTT